MIRRDNLYWPIFGSFEEWICRALNTYVTCKKPFNREECDYAALWVKQSKPSLIYTLKEKEDEDKKKVTWEPLNNLLPPYNTENTEDPPLASTPSPSGISIAERTCSSQRNTRRDSISREEGDNDTKARLYPLREVPLAGQQAGLIGFVNVPLNTGEVRNFKKEMGKLLEDPIGVSERLDQFLGPSMYTWVELQSILSILFTTEEREMIRQAGMRVWDREHQIGSRGDQKWPLNNPNWDNPNYVHRQNMMDLRWILVKGIRESVPKGQNINKAFSEQQRKDESPTDWLERLRKDLQMYSGIDPDTQVGQALLKTQFVARSWGDIRKKLEKLDNWQDRELQKLLREAQKVYVRRDEKKQKTKTKIFIAAVRETQKETQRKGGGKPRKPPQKQGNEAGNNSTRQTCFYCNKKGHIKKNCKERIRDEKMFQEDE